jgi:hypothetical protein
MNRHRRRAAAAKKRKFEVGTMIYTKTVAVTLTTGEKRLYWFEEPDGYSSADGERLLAWMRGERAGSPGVKLFGPFKTDAEVRESERLTLLGQQCKVTGVIHPAPARLQ